MTFHLMFEVKDINVTALVGMLTSQYFGKIILLEKCRWGEGHPLLSKYF